MTLGRVDTLSFGYTLGFLEYFRLRNAIGECTNGFDGNWHL